MAVSADKDLTAGSRWPSRTHYETAIRIIDELGSELTRGLKLRMNGRRAEAYDGGAGWVFHATENGRHYALKVFKKPALQRTARYEVIHRHLKAQRSPMFVDFAFDEKAIRVTNEDYVTHVYPAVRMEWCAGATLDVAIETALQGRYDADAWVRRWLEVVSQLRSSRTAHGDLQHGNVLVADKGRMRLIDYDGMFVPAMTDLGAVESGHIAYQHPDRQKPGAPFDEHLDHVSALVILTSLAAVTRELWANRDTEGLLLGHEDLARRGHSERVDQLAERPEPVPTLVRLLREALAAPLGPCPQLDQAAELYGVTLPPVGGKVRAKVPAKDRVVLEQLAPWEVEVRTATAETKRTPVKRQPAKRAAAQPGPAKRAPAKRAPAKRAPAKQAVAGTSRGAEFETDSRWEAALASYDAVLKSNPDHLPALIGRGRVLTQLGRTVTAVKTFTRALESAPADADALLGRARALRRLGHLKAALEDAERVLASDPGSALARVEHGWTSLSFTSGHLDEAANAFRHALKASPGLADARLGRAVAAILRGERATARKALAAVGAEPSTGGAGLTAANAALRALEGDRSALAVLAHLADEAPERRAISRLSAHVRATVAKSEQGKPPTAAKPKRTPPPAVPKRVPTATPPPAVPRIVTPPVFPAPTWRPAAGGYAALGAPFLTGGQRRELWRAISVSADMGLEQLLWLARFNGPGERAHRNAILLTSVHLVWTRPGFLGRTASEQVFWKDVQSVRTGSASLSVQFRDKPPLTIAAIGASGPLDGTTTVRNWVDLGAVMTARMSAGQGPTTSSR